jgi:hypothetical protein
MLNVSIIPLLVCLVGLLIYALATNGKVVGLLIYAFGLLVTLLVFAKQVFRLG